MKNRNILIALLLMIACTTSYAQDRIYMYNKDIISAKIKNVSPDVVTYKRYDNPDGPDYTVFTNDVIKIVYANGSQDIMNEKLARRIKDNTKQSKEDAKLAKMHNIVYVAPLQFTENGYGFSFAYERYLDKDGLFRFYLPAIATFNLFNNTYNETNGNTIVREDPMYYVMPGFKVRVKEIEDNRAVFLGTSLVFGEGTKTSGGNVTGYSTNPPYSPIYSNIIAQSKTVFGMMAHISGNLCPSPRLYLTGEIGFGYTYTYTLAGIPQNNSGLFELGFKIGYRY